MIKTFIGKRRVDFDVDAAATQLATMTDGMIARPSRPSVRFTALLMPTIMRYVSATKPTPESGTAKSLKNGTNSTLPQ